MSYVFFFFESDVFISMIKGDESMPIVMFAARKVMSNLTPNFGAAVFKTQLTAIFQLTYVCGGGACACVTVVKSCFLAPKK